VSIFKARTEDSSATQYFQFYGYLSQQQNMMQVTISFRGVGSDAISLLKIESVVRNVNCDNFCQLNYFSLTPSKTIR
jgi:hypothetical protein